MRQLEQVPLTAEVLERSADPIVCVCRAGRAARALITSALAHSEGTPLLVVVPTLEETVRWAALLELMGWPTTQLYPTSEITWGQLQVLSELLALNSIGAP